MQAKTESTFYKFLNQEISLKEFEEFLYHSPTLEKELGTEIHLELISFNYSQADELKTARDFILDIVIDEGAFEKWKLLKVLDQLISFPDLLKKLQDWISDMYFFKGYNRKGKYIDKGYTFLKHLGENPLLWMNSHELESNFGVNKNIALKKYQSEIIFYHRQLVPYAIAIKEALEKREVIIHAPFEYEISEEAKKQLEEGKPFKLSHP